MGLSVGCNGTRGADAVLLSMIVSARMSCGWRNLSEVSLCSWGGIPVVCIFVSPPMAAVL